MSSVQFRSESPYVPRPIEREEVRGRGIAALDHGALRVLIVAGPQLGTHNESALVELANALCNNGHVVDFIAEDPSSALDGRVRLIKLQEAVRAKRAAGLGDLFGALSSRVKAERRLSGCLAHIAAERAADYDLVIDNQTLLDEVFAFKARGIKVFGFISQPRAIERSARKTVRALDGVLAPSEAIAEEVIAELGAPRAHVETLEKARFAGTVSRLYARSAARRR